MEEVVVEGGPGWDRDQDQVDPKWLSHLPLITSMGSMGGAFQGHQGCPTTPIYIRWVLLNDCTIDRWSPLDITSVFPGPSFEA